MKQLIWFALALAPAARGQANDLAGLSDEFCDPLSQAAWTNRHVAEGLGFDPLAEWTIDSAAHPDGMRMVPQTVTWYAGWKGPLVSKDVGGDLVLTTRVTISNRAGNGLPSSHYSLAGLMLRAPTSGASSPENYVFLSLGVANAAQWPNAGPGPHFEVKTTVDSVSTLSVTAANTTTVELQLARLGSVVVALFRRPNEGWSVHRRYQRPDFPAVLQAGFVAYTDWDKVATYTPLFHNTHLLVPPIANDPSTNPSLPFQPDLAAEFAYAHFARPRVPPGLDPWTASDGELLAFLGDAANPSYATYCSAGTTSGGCQPSISAVGEPSASSASGFVLSIQGAEGQRTGLVFYGTNGAQASPWGASFLCIKAPTQRTDVQSSGGSAGACDGSLGLDWNAFCASHPGALGAPFHSGDAVWAQAWMRDPPSAKTTSLSDALTFHVSP